MRAALMLLAVCCACGYRVEPERSWSSGPSGSLPSVAVLPFENLTYRRGLEMRLTRLIGDELRGRAPAAASSPDRADWHLDGRILRANEQILSEDRQDDVRESSFVVTVEVVLKDRATEKVLRTYSFTERAPFSPRSGRVATLESAQDETLRDLAERIVYWLEARGQKIDS